LGGARFHDYCKKNCSLTSNWTRIAVNTLGRLIKHPRCRTVERGRSCARRAATVEQRSEEEERAPTTKQGREAISSSTFSHVEGANLHRGSFLLCCAGECAGAGLSGKVCHGGCAIPGGRSERRRGPDRDRTDGEAPRTIDGHRECRRWRGHDRKRARGGSASRRVHLARGQYGIPCRRARAHAKRKIRFRA
jgi:hypothetical protein